MAQVGRPFPERPTDNTVLGESVLWNTQINPFPPLQFENNVESQTSPIWTEVNPATAVAQAEAIVHSDINQPQRNILPHIPASMAVRFAGNTAKYASNIISNHNASADASLVDKVAKHAFEMGTRTVVARRRKDGLIPRALNDEWNFLRERTRRRNTDPTASMPLQGPSDSDPAAQSSRYSEASVCS